MPAGIHHRRHHHLQVADVIALVLIGCIIFGQVLTLVLFSIADKYEKWDR